MLQPTNKMVLGPLSTANAVRMANGAERQATNTASALVRRFIHKLLLTLSWAIHSRKRPGSDRDSAFIEGIAIGMPSPRRNRLAAEIGHRCGFAADEWNLEGKLTAPSAFQYETIRFSGYHPENPGRSEHRRSI
jgi:hypothetical protein